MNINVNINHANIYTVDSQGIPGCDIEPKDIAAEVKHLSDEYDMMSIEPCDHLARPLVNWPVEFKFSLPAIPGIRGDGFHPVKGLKARLLYLDGTGHYYRITGNTVRSRKLLRDAGCEYGPYCGWICKDYNRLKPYVDQD